MPWCEECSKYWTPSAMNADGTCPSCGRTMSDAVERAKQAADDERTPWHFKVLVVALIAYLVWRVVDLFV